MTHTEEVKYHCPSKDFAKRKGFKSLSNYRMHMDTHSGETFPCKEKGCDYGQKQNTNYLIIREDNMDHKSRAPIKIRGAISNHETKDRLRNMLTLFANTRIRYVIFPGALKVVGLYMTFTGATNAI